MNNASVIGTVPAHVSPDVYAAVLSVLFELAHESGLDRQGQDWLIRQHALHLSLTGRDSDARKEPFRHVQSAATRREINGLLRNLERLQDYLARNPLHGPAIDALAANGVLRSEMTGSLVHKRDRIIAARDMFRDGAPCPMRERFPDHACSKKPPDHRANAVDLLARKAYTDLTGKVPTRIVRLVPMKHRTTQRTGGPYVTFLDALYKALGIKASAAHRGTSKPIDL